MIANMTKYALYILALSGLLSACSEEDLSSASILPQQEQATVLDSWLEEHIAKPYQAEVIYRWDRNHAPLATYTYPPKIEQVRPVLEALEATVLKMYSDKAFFPSQDFMPRNPILKIYLYGGSNIDQQGIDMPFDREAPAISMRIYNVDKFDPSKPEEVYRLVRSAQHQIAKHLMDIHPYDHNRFLQISGQRYTGSTEAFADAYKSYQREGTALKERMGLNRYAYSRGFYSILAMLSARDDLAEMYSITMTSTPAEIDAAERDAAIPDRADGDADASQRYREEAIIAHKAFVEKRQFLTSYISSQWRTTLQRLQLQSLTLINQYNNAHATTQP